MAAKAIEEEVSAQEPKRLKRPRDEEDERESIVTKTVDRHEESTIISAEDVLFTLVLGALQEPENTNAKTIVGTCEELGWGALVEHAKVVLEEENGEEDAVDEDLEELLRDAGDEGDVS